MRLTLPSITRLPGIARDTVRTWRWTGSLLADIRDAHPPALMAAPANERPHLLLLARALPPGVNGGIYRPTALMRAADRRGWRVTAVTQAQTSCPSRAGLELLRTIPGSVRISRYPPPPPDDSSHYFSARLSGRLETVPPMISAALAACADSPPTVVMASGPPFGEFVAALLLSRRWQVPLVLDYRDEWTQCPFEFVGVGNTDWLWEPRCLRAAALVFFTTESQRLHQVRRFPELDSARTLVAPNGSHEDRGGPGPLALPPEPATIAFLGHLAEHCDLGEFLDTLDRAGRSAPDLTGRVQFTFVGKKTQAELGLLEHFAAPALIRAIDHVPLSEAQAIMRQSAALMLFNPPRLARYIPGKAYDYIGARRRILLYGQGGELERLLADYPSAIRVNRRDPGALAAALRTIADDPNPPARPVSHEFLARCSRARSAENQIMALERLRPASIAPSAVV